MSGIQVDANRCAREWRAFMKKHDKYCDELVAINQAENTFIESLPGSIKHDQFEYYMEHYPEKYNGYEKAREDLKKKYGMYSSIYLCPYYTIVTTASQLAKVVGKDAANFKSFKRSLFKWKGKHVQSTYKKEHGICKGLAVCLDDVYICFHDEIDNREVWEFEVEPYKREDWLPYKIVTNGKDYL